MSLSLFHPAVTVALFASQIRRHSTATSWEHIERAPPDSILGLNKLFEDDKSTSKVNLGVGAYRDDKGKPVVLPSVKAMEKKLIEAPDHSHEYLPVQMF